MFEDAKADLTDALNDKQAPVSMAAAKAASDETDFMVETGINNFGSTETHNGITYLTAIEDGPSFDISDLPEDERTRDEGATADDDEEDDEADAEPAADEEDDEEDADPSEEDSTSQAPAQDRSWDADDDVDVYEVNGLRIDVDPEQHLAGQPTGDDWYGLPVLSNGHTNTPDEHVPYYPVETTMGVDSEMAMGRVLGVMNRPLLWEGESGTGKNRAIDRALAATNRTKQRINFSADLSVFDLVGEKDFDDEGSYFILGKLAKAVMFGHTAVFDEANMVSGDVSSFAHAIAEGPGERELELRGTGRTLQDIPVSEEEIEQHGSWYEAARAKWDVEEHLGKYIHPEFRLTGTSNPLTYASTSQMNGAFRDRFVTLEHEYLDADMEGELLEAETGADPSDTQDLVDLFHVLRESKEETNMPTCPITHRKLVDIVEFAGPDEQFASFKAAAEQILVKHASTKSDQQYIMDAVRDEL